METRVARIREYGGPEVLKIETDTLPEPGPGEVVLRQDAAAIAFADTLIASIELHEGNIDAAEKRLRLALKTKQIALGNTRAAAALARGFWRAFHSEI